MTIAQDNMIKSQEVVDYFNNNVYNYAANYTTYSTSSSVPKFTSTVLAQTYQYTQSQTYSYRTDATYSDQNAVPTTELSALDAANDTATLDKIGAVDSVITASTVLNALNAITTRLTRMKKFTSYWYQQQTYNGTTAITAVDNLKETKTGALIQGVTTPAISGTTRPYYTKTPNTTTNTTSISYNNLQKLTEISSSAFITFINNLKSGWLSSYNTGVVYKYYICHISCYSNTCYTRARR